MNLQDISPYKMTLLGAVIVLALSYAALVALGGAQNAAPYLTLIGSVAIPALLALLRADQTAAQQKTAFREQQSNHQENQALITDSQAQIVELRQALDRRTASVDQQLRDAVEAGREDEREQIAPPLPPAPTPAATPTTQLPPHG